ncbi:MAG: NAD-dependent epimerase/dehydratase family protein [Dehalococcoidia bacterium]|nr:MAG: NAD-dependent epimerase/dehydratase family protein [Dehalococcoidia bacterium]
MPETFWHGRSVFVTGAGGFVGSWLARALVERGATVTVILRDEPAQQNPRPFGERTGVNILRGSITEYAAVERAINEYDVDTVFHLAAQAIVGPANRSPLSTFESNIRGTWTVLEASRSCDTVRRVVIASSDKAYGAQPALPYVETAQLLGSAPYEASKVCADVLARSYHLAFDLPVAVARCANIYGGGDFNLSRLVPGTIKSILAGEPPIIRSDGTPVRDYLYVDDAVSAYLALGQCPDEALSGDSAFNFGSGEPVSVLDLVRRIAAACGTPGIEPRVLGEGPGTNEIDRQFLDSHKAATVLGWAPRVPLDEGLRRTVQWYRRLLSEERVAA